MSSTGWRKFAGANSMMRSSSSHARFGQSCLTLLSELESSLAAGQRALLARDRLPFERLTEQQESLQQALAALVHSSDCRGSGEPVSDSPATSQLLACAARVLHLGRVQLALLRRAQRSLQMISRLAAGPQATYGPSGSSAIPARENRLRSEEA